MSPPKNSRNVTALRNSLNAFSFAAACSLDGAENLFAYPEPTLLSLPPPISTVFVVPAAQHCDQAQIRSAVATGITRINITCKRPRLTTEVSDGDEPHLTVQ